MEAPRVKLLQKHHGQMQANLQRFADAAEQ